MSSFTLVLLAACLMTYNCILNSFVDKIFDYSCVIEDKTHKIVAELVWFVLPLWILHIPEVVKRLSYKWWLKVPVIAVFPPLFMTCVCVFAQSNFHWNTSVKKSPT